MLRALRHLFGREKGQLAFDFDPPPQTPEGLLARLRAEGLHGIDRLRLTRNRTVMVSFRDRELRVHEGYLDANVAVLRAIVTFVIARSRADRRAAQRVILAHQVTRPGPAPRTARTAADDEPLAEQLTEWHRRYNERYFDGALKNVPIRVSRRMRSRLGHYTAATPSGDPAELVISRDHIRRHGWEEALHTLLHEMVHQWQDETGIEIDHGRAFRQKAREVGVAPSARRSVGRRKRAQAIDLRAARDL